MTTVGERMGMLRRGIEEDVYHGWSRLTQHWWDNEGLTRRLYVCDGLSANGHEDQYATGLDTICVEGPGFDCMIYHYDKVPRLKTPWFHGRTFAISNDDYSLTLDASGSWDSEPGAPPDVLCRNGWNRRDLTALARAVMFDDLASLEGRTELDLGNGLAVSLGGLGSARVPEELTASVRYRCGGLSLDIEGVPTPTEGGISFCFGIQNILTLNVPPDIVTEASEGVGTGYEATRRWLSAHGGHVDEKPADGRLVGDDGIYRPTLHRLPKGFPAPKRDALNPKELFPDFECDLYSMGNRPREWMPQYSGRKPGEHELLFLFKPTAFKIYGWDLEVDFETGLAMNQPLSLTELASLFRICREHREALEETTGGIENDDA